MWNILRPLISQQSLCWGSVGLKANDHRGFICQQGDIMWSCEWFGWLRKFQTRNPTVRSGLQRYGQKAVQLNRHLLHGPKPLWCLPFNTVCVFLLTDLWNHQPVLADPLLPEGLTPCLKTSPPTALQHTTCESNSKNTRKSSNRCYVVYRDISTETKTNRHTNRHTTR